MTTRRDFIASAAGLAFVGCDLLAARAAGAQGGRRETFVAGRRAKVIDVHAHCAVPEAMALMGLKLGGPSLRPDLHMESTIAQRIATMDAQGIDMQVLSINPYWYNAERDVAEKLIQIQNEKLAEACGKHADRFVACASVALQHPELAARQLEEGVKKYGLRGAAVGGSVDGMEVSDAKFHPFWAKAEELGVLVFIHPQATGAQADLGKRLKGNGYLENVIGWPVETSIALSHLIFEGTLDRFPGLKICAAHGGGYLPFYAPRSDAICVTFPDRCASVPLKKKPTEYLKQLYYDSIVFTPQALKSLIAEVGVDRIMIGTDYPFPWTHTSVDHILNTPGLSDADRTAMLGDTAARLLGISIN
jgi:aminocarboxymuconate-semialdehyde decarboxylase